MVKRKGKRVFFPLIFIIAILSAIPWISKKMGWLYDDVHTVKSLKIASITMQVDIASQVNRQKMIAMIKAVRQSHPDVELILFGESILGWYTRKAETAAYLQSFAERIPGETTTVMSGLAKEYGIYLSFGIPEARDGELYNSQVLIDPEGKIIAVHRKVNLQGSQVYQPGEVPVDMADIKGIKTAVIICSDIQDPKVRSRLNSEQPELILGSLANPSDPNWFVSGLIAKLFDAWIVTANRYGAEDKFFFDGQMIVSDPLGELRVKTKDREQFVFYEIKFSEDRSPLVKILRRAYAGESLVVHFIQSVGMLFPAR